MQINDPNSSVKHRVRSRKKNCSFGGGLTIGSPSKDTTFLRDGICQASNGWLKIIESVDNISRSDNSSDISSFFFFFFIF